MNNTQITQITQTDLGSSESKSDKFKCRKYFITINNYTDTHFSNMLEMCKKSEIWFWCKEVGKKCGTPHFHLWIQFKNARLRTTLKKEIGKDGNYQGAKGTLEQSSCYQKKDGVWDTNIRSLKWKGPEIELYEWQKDLVNILNKEPDNRTVHWVWEPSGCEGKTVFQKWFCFRNSDTIVLGGKGSNMKNGIIEYIEKNSDFPKTVFINIPRSETDEDKVFVSYGGIEAVKDMFFYSGKYKGGMVNGPNPHVMVFANVPPDKNKLSHDRWNIIKLNLEESVENNTYDDYFIN